MAQPTNTISIGAFGSGNDYTVDPSKAYPDAASFVAKMEEAYAAYCEDQLAGDITIYPCAPSAGVLGLYTIDSIIRIKRRPVHIIQTANTVWQKTKDALQAWEFGTRVIFDNFSGVFDISTTDASQSCALFRTGDKYTCSINATTSQILRQDVSKDWRDDGFKAGDYVQTEDFPTSANNVFGKVYEPINQLNFKISLATGGPLVSENGGGVATVKRLYQYGGSIIRGGVISICGTNATIPDFWVFRASGLSSDNLGPPITIENMTLEIRNIGLDGTGSAQQTNAWVGTPYASNPYGIGFAKFKWMYNARVVNCRMRQQGTHQFTLDPTSTGHWAGMFLEFDSCFECQALNNSFLGVALSASTSHEALPMIRVHHTAGGEGGHMKILAIESENCVAEHAVWTDAPWTNIDGVQCGRWYPGKTKSLIRIAGGRGSVVQNTSGHNVNGPGNNGTFGVVNGELVGTNVALGFEEGDWIGIDGLSAAADGYYEIATIPDLDTITFLPDCAPPDTAAVADVGVRQQPWLAKVSDSARDARIQIDSTLRRSSCPPVKIDGCSGIVVELGVIDTFESGA